MDIQNVISFIWRASASLSPLLVWWGIIQLCIQIAQKKDRNLVLVCRKCCTIINPTISKLGVQINILKGELENARVLSFHAYVANKGKKDVRLTNDLSPITLHCSKSYRWLNAAVEKTPKNMICNALIRSDQDLSIDWDLLKKGETIHFVGIAEIIGRKRNEDTLQFYRSLEIISRIEDVPPIQKKLENEDESIVREYRNLIESKQLYFMGVLIVVLGLFVHFFGPDYKEINVDSVYEPVYSVGLKSDNSIQEIIITASGDSIVTTPLDVKGKLGSSEKISVSEFNKQYNISDIGSIRYPQKKMIELIVVYMGLALIVLTFITDFIRSLIVRHKT
ncbi:MAG: hypothetical protein PHD87_00135 [Candidatus Cloacimonetes bacterium]|nr:hypothetical protein [Candidatus Cloacimonadota bacterium]